jgi:hypothetical protein
MNTAKLLVVKVINVARQCCDTSASSRRSETFSAVELPQSILRCLDPLLQSCVYHSAFGEKLGAFDKSEEG